MASDVSHLFLGMRKTLVCLDNDNSPLLINTVALCMYLLMRSFPKT